MFGLLFISGYEAGAVKSNPDFPFCECVQFPVARLNTPNRSRFGAPPGGHPSLAVSPLPPGPKKNRAATKWENIGGPGFCRRANRFLVLKSLVADIWGSALGSEELKNVLSLQVILPKIMSEDIF